MPLMHCLSQSYLWGPFCPAIRRTRWLKIQRLGVVVLLPSLSFADPPQFLALWNKAFYYSNLLFTANSSNSRYLMVAHSDRNKPQVAPLLGDMYGYCLRRSARLNVFTPAPKNSTILPTTPKALNCVLPGQY